MTDTTIPILMAREVSGKTVSGWAVWCPYCLSDHFHSAGAGHRVAHCGDLCGVCRITRRKRGPKCDHPNPLRDSGYIIALTPKDVRDCARRERREEEASEKAARKAAREEARRKREERQLQVKSALAALAARPELGRFTHQRRAQ